LPNTKSGAVDAEPIKVKGNIHWLSTQHAITAEVRLYDRLFTTDHPGAGDRDFLLDINPNARTIIQAQIESSLTTLAPGTCVQFERHGYFVADLQDSKPTAPVFNRTVTLRDSWSK
jgi:glutaminyl-tRNA synthetase